MLTIALVFVLFLMPMAFFLYSCLRADKEYDHHAPGWVESGKMTLEDVEKLLIATGSRPLADVAEPTDEELEVLEAQIEAEDWEEELIKKDSIQQDKEFFDGKFIWEKASEKVYNKPALVVQRMADELVYWSWTN